MNPFSLNALDRNSRIFLFFLLIIKLFCLCVFSSDYQNTLFIPFVKHFLTHLDNPWNYVYQNPNSGMEFPYSPVMLYILSLCYAPIYWLKVQSPLVINFFFKLPTLFADVAILGLLLRICSNQRKVLIYYFATPIILYAAYMHSQVDLIPTAFLFFSVYLLTKNRLMFSALLLGIGVCTKFHIIAALPLMLIFIYRKKTLMDVFQYLFISMGVYFVLVMPYMGEGYYHLVLSNPKQMLVYDAFVSIGDIKVYLPVLLVVIIYARYAAFRKINNDLLYTFLALVFAAFVALTKPSPGWYVWLFPFLSIFFIKFEDLAPEIFKLYLALNFSYLVYMVIFFIPDYTDLIFLESVWQFKIHSEKLRNLSFTFLEVTLVASMYAYYKFGIKSNFVYKRNAPTVIGIAGESAAGKTTLLSDLRSLLGEKVLKLEGDADHKWERGDENWEELTHLNPKANYLYKQYEDIINLQYGKSIYRSDYDHKTGKFALAQKIKAKDYILLSGLHAFYLPKMRKAIDLKIYVNTDEKLRKHWKVLRDVQQRGHRKEEVIKQIDARRVDAKKYVQPQYDFADLVVNYFTEQNYAVGDEHVDLKMKMRVTLDSNIPLDELIIHLKKKVDVEWDYAQDLETQTITISGVLTKEDICVLAQAVIINLEDLISEEPIWLEGYRGFIQLMALLSLSEKIRLLGGKRLEDV